MIVRVATHHLRCCLMLAVLIGLLSLGSRSASAAGCHRGDRPTVGEFQALWIEATAVDPLLESNVPAHVPPGQFVPRPCSEPVPSQIAPGHSSLPAWEDVASEVHLPASLVDRRPIAPTLPYDYQATTSLRRPPRTTRAPR